MSESNSSSSSGIGVFGLLGVAFVILKLCHVINWSWWWVTAPFWGGFAIIAFVLIVIFFGVALGEARRQSKRRQSKRRQSKR